MPSNEHATATGSSAPRFGRVNCLDAEAFAQLCARLDPMPGNPGELSEGLPVCHIPARKGSSIGRYRVRTCWNDDDEDFVRAGASDAEKRFGIREGDRCLTAVTLHVS